MAMNDQPPEACIILKDLRKTVIMSHTERPLNTEIITTPGLIQTTQMDTSNKMPTHITSTVDDTVYIQADKPKDLPKFDGSYGKWLSW